MMNVGTAQRSLKRVSTSKLRAGAGEEHEVGKGQKSYTHWMSNEERVLGRRWPTVKNATRSHGLEMEERAFNSAAEDHGVLAERIFGSLVWVEDQPLSTRLPMTNTSSLLQQLLL